MSTTLCVGLSVYVIGPWPPLMSHWKSAGFVVKRLFSPGTILSTVSVTLCVGVTVCVCVCVAFFNSLEKSRTGEIKESSAFHTHKCAVSTLSCKELTVSLLKYSWRFPE